MKYFFMILFLVSSAGAGTNITSSSTGMTFASDGMSKTVLDSAMAAQLTAIKEAMPKCSPTDMAPVLAAIADLKASIGSGGGGGTTPQPTPAPTPVVGKGIFIGSKEFGSLADAAAAYKTGETVKITKSLVNQSAAFVNGKVTIDCAPGVHLEWKLGSGTRMAWGKGTFVFDGLTDEVVMNNCEASGAQVVDKNGAAVRFGEKVQKATFNNVNFHDNENGILGAAKVTIIKDSRFWHNGIDARGQTHNVYFSAADEVNVSNSYFGSTKGTSSAGNIFKSRAKKTVIDRSVLGADAEAGWSGSWVIDIPNGGDVKITNSVIYKSDFSAQGNFFSFAVEGASADGRGNSYELTNNMIISDHKYSHFGVFKNSPAMNVTGNTFVGVINGAPAAGNKIFKTRAEAGLPAAPTLPAVK